MHTNKKLKYWKYYEIIDYNYYRIKIFSNNLNLHSSISHIAHIAQLFLINKILIDLYVCSFY